MRKYTLNCAGNLQDVYNSIKCNWDRVTIADLEAALQHERKHQARKSFIQLIERSIKRKRKEAANG